MPVLLTAVLDTNESNISSNVHLCKLIGITSLEWLVGVLRKLAVYFK